MTSRLFAFLFLAAVVSCAHDRPSTSWSEGDRDPSATRGVPLGKRLADFETEPNQEVFWANEDQIFRDMQREVIDNINRQTAGHHQEPNQRGFHAKTHTCLRGLLIPAPKRSDAARYGVFKDDSQWQFWARFSNGSGWRAADNVPDIRGLALKLIHVPGSKLMDDESETQDFIMINTPVGFGSDSREFMDFAKTISESDGMVRAISSAIHNPSTRTAILNSLTTSFTRSLITLQFWSGTPYRLGSKQAIKYTVKPEKCIDDDEHFELRPAGSKFGADKFRKDLYLQAEQGFCMGFYVQFQSKNVKKTPIEDAAVEWTSDLSPFERIAQLQFFPQKYTETEKAQLESMCTKMSFNPWHSLDDHRPLGNQNRARRWVYDASRSHRDGGRAQNPLNDRGWDFF